MSGGPYEVAFLLLVTHKVQSVGGGAMPEALGYSRGSLTSCVFLLSTISCCRFWDSRARI